MKRKALTIRYNQNIVNAVVLTLVLAMLLYLGIQISRGFYSKVSTQRTQSITESEYAYLEGCIFRDDSVIKADGDVVYYTVQNGDKVGVGQSFAEVFSNTGLSSGECADIQKRLGSLSAAIALLESSLGSGSSLGQINDAITSGYYAYIDSVLAGDFASADKTGNGLLSNLADHSAITSGDIVRDRLSVLKDERQALLDSIGGVKRSLISDKSFNFFYSSDGYEEFMHVSMLGGMTRTQLDLLMSGTPNGEGDAIGRATENLKWYLAIPLDNATAERFRPLEGGTFTVDFLGFEDLEVSMLLERVYADEDGFYMLMSSHSLSLINSLDRFQSVRILLDRYTGYRVPAGALHNVDGVDGVYILIGNVIEFRRVTVMSTGNDHYIVDTYESDLQNSQNSEIPYLNINDLIVTSGNDLYDGKQLN